jgi:hypothetical protein
LSSRQSANAASSSGFQYAAPATFANVQLDILYSNETSDPSNFGTVNGTGSNTVARQLHPILPVSTAVATPSAVYGSTGASVGTSGLTSSGTTATCTLGDPHGYAIGASSVTVTIVTANSSYNVTAAAATITGPYTFTYTTTGSGLPAAGGGTASMQVPAWSVTQSGPALPAASTIGTTGQPYSPSVVGSTINGQVVGTLEFWADLTQWDTSNNRAVMFTNIDPTVQWKSS